MLYLGIDLHRRQMTVSLRKEDVMATMPGVSTFIALAIVCRIAPGGRFPHGRSLANFLGLTPSCRSSGDTELPGAITNVGSRMVYCLLAEVMLHLLRYRDKRGGKIRETPLDGQDCFRDDRPRALPPQPGRRAVRSVRGGFMRC